MAANYWAQSVTLGKRIWLLGVITKSVVRKPNIATHAKSVVFYIVLQHCITTCFVISHHSKPTNRFTSFVILSTQEWTSMTLNSLDVQSCQKWVVTIFIQNPHWTIELWIDHSPRFTQANTGYNPFQSKSYPKGIMGQFLSIPSYGCFSIQLAYPEYSRITTSSRATEILDLGKAGVHCAIHLSRGERIREGPRDLQVLVRNCRWWCWTGWHKNKNKNKTNATKHERLWKLYTFGFQTFWHFHEAFVELVVELVEPSFKKCAHYWRSASQICLL